MYKALLFCFAIFGTLNLPAQNSEDKIIVSEVVIQNITAKFTIDNGKKLFQITVKDEDHSCVVDFCGISYNGNDKNFTKNINTLDQNLKEIYKTFGNLKRCDVLKWEDEGIKFTLYGIAPNLAYICIDGHGHGTITKDEVKKFYTWIDSLDYK